MSIRLRLMLIFASMVAVILSVFSVFVYYSTVSIRKSAFFDRLWERTEISLQLISETPRPDLSKIHPSERNTYWTILPDEEIIIFDDSGRYSYINEFTAVKIDYEPVLNHLKVAGSIEKKIGQRQIVGISKRIDDQTYYVIVSAFDKNGQRLLNNLRLTMVSSFLTSIIFTFLAGWYFSRETFKPVERIIETAEKISETDLDLRVPIPAGKNELVRLVNTINESLDRLQKAFEVQKVFVANASHELRTPLTALRGELEVALLKDRSKDEYKHILTMAYDDAKRLSSLVNHLLLFAQTSSDPRSLNFESIRIDEIVMDVMQKFSTIYPDRQIEIRFTNQIPDETKLIVSGNENLLAVAINNVIDNALKYSDRKPVHIEINSGDKIKISIADKGVGISLNDMESVFEPFYRSKRSSNVVGFGLGLALAKKIIELHGGNIIIKSKINEGSKITILLPKEI